MTLKIKAARDLPLYVGNELAVSEWVTIDQEQVCAFANATRDQDWMHVDPDRARKGPIGQPIVQGFLTLSMLIYFSHQTNNLPDCEYAFNYGLDRVRWPGVVKVGARIRNRSTLLEAREKGEMRWLLKTSNIVEIEGEKVPAMTAEWLTLLHEQRGGPDDSPLEGRQG